MDELYVQPEEVHRLGQVWSQAGEELQGQAVNIRAGRLDPSHFGSHYADQVGDVTAAFDRLENTWRGWGNHCGKYSASLHQAADSYRAADQA